MHSPSGSNISFLLLFYWEAAIRVAILRKCCRQEEHRGRQKVYDGDCETIHIYHSVLVASFQLLLHNVFTPQVNKLVKSTDVITLQIGVNDIFIIPIVSCISTIVTPSILSIRSSIDMEIYNSPLKFTRDCTHKA